MPEILSCVLVPLLSHPLQPPLLTMAELPHHHDSYTLYCCIIVLSLRVENKKCSQAKKFRYFAQDCFMATVWVLLVAYWSKYKLSRLLFYPTALNK